MDGYLTQDPPPGSVPVKKTAGADLPPGSVLVKKKENTVDFTHGYKPTPEDLKQKKDLNDLETSVTKSPNGSKPSHPTDKGSWSNIPVFGAREVFGGLEKDLGNLFGYAKDKIKQAGWTGASDALGSIQDFWKGAQKEDEQVSSKHQLPNTTMGHIATTATKFVPDIIELAATPELDLAKLGKVGTYASKLGKVGGKVAQMAVSKFPIQQATKKMLQSYSDAKDKGEDPDVAALKGFGEGYKDGLIFEGAGQVAGKLTKLGTDALEKVGVMSGNKFVAGAEKRLLHSAAQAVTFSAAPVLQNAVEGKGTDLNEIKSNGIFGAVLGGITGYHGDAENTGADKSAAQVLMRKPLVDLHNFVNADLGDIKNIHESDISAPDLQAQSISHAENGFKTDDTDEKSKEVIQSALKGKAASVKSVTESILKDKDGVIDEINQMDLPDEAKKAAIDKVNQVHKELDPTEQKKTGISDQIDKNNATLEQLKPNDGESAGEKIEREAKVADIEKQNKELTNQYTDLLKNQQNEKGNKEKSSGGGEQVAARTSVSVSSGSEGDQNEEVNAELNRETGSQQQEGDDEKGQAQNDIKPTGEVRQLADEPVKEENGEKQTKQGEKPSELPTEAPKKDATADKEKPDNTTDEKSGDTIEPEKTTGIKKAISEATRAEKQLPEVKLNKLSPQHEVLKNGKYLVESKKIEPSKVAQDIIANPRTYTPDETDAMLYYGHQLARQETNLRSAIAENEDPATHTVLNSNLQQLNDAIDAKTQADRINSREWSNLGNRMQIEADQSFSPANIRSVIKENYGGKIPKEVEERITKAESERDKAIADLKKATENQIKKEGAKTVEKIRKSIKLIKQTKAELEQEATDLVKQLRVALKSDASHMNSGIPLPTETLAVLGKLAVNYFKQGIKDFEGLANRIYDDLKEEGVKKDDIREYLSNYEPLRDESRERHLELLGRKERSAEKQLSTGKIRDYTRKPKINFKKDAEVIKAEQRVSDAEYKIKQEKSKSYKATENKYQRGLNWVIRWERRSVLASPKILEKLASAATIGSAINRIPKQIIGKAFSAIFKGITNKAMIEGGLNMDAELKFWKEFTDPAKFVKNAGEILKTGASPLTRRFSEQSHEHYAGYDALMDLHSIIKDPPKRATFEASLRYAYDWAAKNNIDYTDPLIKRNLEMAAYKRANYEIFQENNGISKRVNDFINSERKRTDAEATKKFLYRFLIPISTVPMNIARRIGSSVVGLPHGLYLAADAYKKGIDNLSEEQADYVMRQLKNGSVGAAYLAVGLFSSQAIMGGVWNKDAREGKKSTPTNAGFDEMKLGGQPIDKRIQHAMPLFLMQLGATTARVYNHYMDVPTDDPKYQTMLKSTVQAMTATTGAVVEEIPMIQEPKQALESLSDPYERKRFGEDLKRRVGFGVTDDLGITSKPDTDPLTKKLSTVTNLDGDKKQISPTQLKQRKEIVTKSLSTNPKDWPDPDENRGSWTDDFNDSWEDSDAYKSLQRSVPYLKSIGRSPQYIKNHIDDVKQQKLDEYLEKQAVKFSQDQITDDDGNPVEEQKKPKNTFSIAK